MVTRYAPSPTGFQHIGGVFAALINERLASQSEGSFLLKNRRYRPKKRS